MFQFGNYEILYRSSPTFDDGTDRVVQYIQGAAYNASEQDLSYEIHWKGNIVNSEIEKVSILVENNSLKLGDIFFSSPYGIIKKNRTGIGATTLELRSKRNSIIVVPTRSIAYNKALSGREDNGHWKYLYVGSRFEGIADGIPSINEYLSDTSIANKKLLVVADSLKRVINTIGNNVYDNYFLMIDEIDSYQSDSTYRPILEDVMDYYFRFRYSMRCLVSATINEFSNPKINAETIIELTYSESATRIIKTIHTNNPNAIAKDNIQHIFSTTSDKILIAYNKITNIKQIINGLTEECKSECAILCSAASKRRAGEYYRELIENSLPKRINFITCTYFVGIDIDERYNLISISNTEKYYTTLSIEKITQIAGRCRHSQGLISELIIYNTEAYNSIKNPEDYKREALVLAEDLSTLISQIDYLKDKYNELMGNQFLYVKDDIISKATVKISTNEVNVLRKDINGACVISFFNIDALYEFYKLKQNLYSSIEQLNNELEGQGNQIITSTHYQDVTPEENEINQRVIAEMREIEEDEVEELISKILELYENNMLNDFEITRLSISNLSPICKNFIGRFKDLYHYIPINQLTSKLKEITNFKEYRSLFNSAIFWSLDNNHPFKQKIQSEFTSGTRYTKRMVIQKTNAVINYHLNKTLDDIPAINYINQLCSLTRGNSMGTTYTVKTVNTYNPQNFEGQPVTTIPSDTRLDRLFKFGRE